MLSPYVWAYYSDTIETRTFDKFEELFVSMDVLRDIDFLQIYVWRSYL